MAEDDWVYDSTKDRPGKNPFRKRRKKKGTAKQAWIGFYATKQEKKAWQRCAKKKHSGNLSEFMRDAANAFVDTGS